jgi:competence protein ComEC
VIIWTVSHRQKVAAVIAKGFENAALFVSRLNIKLVIAPLLVIAILVLITGATLPDTKLHVSFLDVGQGDAILIQQGNQQVLVDGGPTRQAINLELGKRMPFWDRTIELVILTHPDADHLTGLVEVLQRYRVEQIIYPDFSSDLPLYTEWQQIIKDKKINITPAQTGQQISLRYGVRIDVLNPTLPASFEAGSDDNGVVARLNMGKTSFLLTADISWQAEFALIARRADIHCTVLKVAHHGSASSTTAEFLSVVKPQVAVISVGKDNKYGHPNPEVINRLETKIGINNIYRTDELGTVEFITNGEKLWVKMN